MLSTEVYGHITRLRFSTARSRAVGYEVSAYLVQDTLIDCGFPDVHGDLVGLLQAQRPQGVVLTHCHEDHAGNVEYLAASHYPLTAPRATLELLRETSPIGFYRRFVWGVPRRLTSDVTPFTLPAGLQLIPAPGHSVDHHVIWEPDTRTLFAGDLFLGVKVRVARPGENPRVLARSLREIAALGPLVMFDSHRGQVPEPVASLNAKADWLDETIARIDQLAAQGMNDHAIRRAVLGPEDSTFYFSAGDLSRINFVRAVRRSG
jgi:glyoxylase-like metal-dependent hydrolase (beta-lactamase superfamily II)